MQSNIAPTKLENDSFSSSLSKSSGYKTPSRKTLADKHMKNIFKQTISNIKDLVADNYIWVYIDETKDSLGRHPTAIVIGILSLTDYIPPFLLKFHFSKK